MKNAKKMLLAVTLGATLLQFGGCLGGSRIWRMLGDAVGDTLAYNVFLD
jgi:hypothetical protein